MAKLTKAEKLLQDQMPGVARMGGRSTEVLASHRHATETQRAAELLASRLKNLY